MDEELRMSEAERALLVELLQREIEELHVEIHHSRVNSVKEELKQRRDLVRGLLERMQPVGAATA
jgi:hypothetical protein